VRPPLNQWLSWKRLSHCSFLGYKWVTKVQG
jgi:hypothetical protein